MPQFLIEVPHGEEQLACLNIVKTFLETGSQFLSRAHWGCKDGVHKAWIIVEVDSKEEARALVPNPLRSQAQVVELNSFTLEEIEELLHHHADDGLSSDSPLK